MRLFDYAASGNCYKVRLLLAHLGREYERVPVDIFAGETLTAEFAAVNPARMTPVLEPEPGCFLPESGAILLYLAEGTNLLPADPVQRAQVQRWLFFEVGSVQPTVAALRMRRLTGRIEEGTPQFERLARSAHHVLAVIEKHLEGRRYIATSAFSIADIALYGYLHVASEAGLDTSRLERMNRWLERVRNEPGHIADLEPIPESAWVGKGRSIWDAPPA